MIKKIAVLLAAYNGEKWISEQLKSITDQISVDITVFISCDLSTDNTIKIIKFKSLISKIRNYSR